MHDLFLRAARVPARFYLLNIVGSAILAGGVTSVAQRFVCGPTGSHAEIGNLVKLGQAKALRAAGSAGPMSRIVHTPVLPPARAPAAAATKQEEEEPKQ
jgi:hypothetical protein